MQHDLDDLLDEAVAAGRAYLEGWMSEPHWARVRAFDVDDLDVAHDRSCPLGVVEGRPFSLAARVNGLSDHLSRTYGFLAPEPVLDHTQFPDAEETIEAAYVGLTERWQRVFREWQTAAPAPHQESPHV